MTVRAVGGPERVKRPRGARRISGMAVEALGREPRPPLPDVALHARRDEVLPAQGPAGEVVIHSHQRPAVGRVALFALAAELAAVNVGVAVGAHRLRRRLAGLVTRAAREAEVPLLEREAGLGV